MGEGEEVRISRRFNILGVSVSRVSIVTTGFYSGRFSKEEADLIRPPHALKVRIIYKRKKDKVRPVNSSFLDRIKLGGTED
jgi:hypothetical protein